VIGGKSNAGVRPTALGSMLQSSVLGAVIPTVHGMVKSPIYPIWAANLRQGDSDKKDKKKGVTTYVENIDVLLGSNPIQRAMQFWGNNNQRYPLNLVKLDTTIPAPTGVSGVLPRSSKITIADPFFYAVVGMTAEVVLSGTFNDYGGQGANAWGPTVFEYPLWNGLLHGPDLIDAGGARWYPFIYLWKESYGNVVALPWTGSFTAPAYSLPNGNGNVHIYYAQLAAEIGRHTPISRLRLTFEPELGDNAAVYAPQPGQRIQYPHFAGMGSENIDLGASGMIPVIKPELMGANTVYPSGDADFADMIEDTVKSGMLQMGTGLGEIHRGVNCNELPGAIQKNLFRQLEPDGTPTVKYLQPLGLGNILLGFCRWRKTVGGTAPGILDDFGNAWTPIMLGGGGLNYGFWYANNATAGDENTVEFLNNSTGGFDYDTRPYILEMDPGSQAVESTASATGDLGGSPGYASCSITVGGNPGEPVYIVAALQCEDDQAGALNALPFHWTNLFNNDEAQVSIMAYRIVHGPGTYEFKIRLPFGGAWALGLIALKSAQPVPYPKSYGKIIDDTTMQLVRNQCRAGGLYGSVSMQSQKKAADWIDDFAFCANAWPLWSGFHLKFIAKSEVSAVGMGAIYIAPTASGPVMDVPENGLIGDSKKPLLTITRKTPAVDKPNIEQIQFQDRFADYNPSMASWPEGSGVTFFGPRKQARHGNQVKTLDMVQDPVVARKLAAITARRNTYVEPIQISGTMQAKYAALLEAGDLITVTDSQINIFRLPIRPTSLKENDDFSVDFTAELFIYGVHAPNDLVATPSAPFQPNSNLTPASVNTPIFIEATPRLSQQAVAQLWIPVSNPDPIYGGCIVYISTDGGSTYNPIGRITGKAVTGVTTADWPTAADPDTTNDLPVDLTESLGSLQSYSATDEDALTYPCYIQGGLSCTTYGLMTYAVAQLTAANKYTLKATGGNHLRRCVFGAPQPLNDVDHPMGSRWAFLNPLGVGIFKINMDPRWIGVALKFKFAAFNIFGGGQQALADCTAYTYTPSGCAGGSSNPNVNNYRVTGGALAQSCSTPTQVTMAQATVTFPSNSANYNARSFTIPTPTAPTTYYITILDPGYLGDTGALTNLLSFIDPTPVKVGQPGYIYMGAVTAVPAGCGVQTGPGGMPATFPAVFTSTPAAVIPLAPGADGNFTVAHGLGVTPAFVMIQMTNGSAIWLQSPTSFDSTNLYLTSADASATGVAVIWTVPADQAVALAPGAAGNFTVAHGLGTTPQLALVEMLSSGAIWFQSTPWDVTNLYLTASDDSVTGKAEVFGTHPISVPIRFAKIPLAPVAAGAFNVAHGLGSVPFAVVIRMTSGAAIWMTGKDSTNLNLVASDAGITGEAEIWG
jgi:hypothetical protein